MRTDLPSQSGCAPVPLRRAAAALAIFLLLAAVGCSGVTASRYCYTAASATVHAVDTGMNVAGDLYREGRIGDPVKAKLVAAHDVYRPIASGIVDGCRALKAGEQKEADEMIRRIQAAGAHVIEALTAAGVR